MQAEEIKQRTIKSIVALSGRTLVLQVANGLTLLLLGVFLDPAAIGIFIVVTAVMRIFSLFTDVGLGAALVQKKQEVDIDDLRAAFTVQEILVLAVVTAAWILTPLVARQAHLDASGVFLYHVLLTALIISSLKVIPSILLERKLAFEKQIIPQLAEAVVFDIIVIFLASKSFGVAAYSWATLASALIGLPIYYWLSPWKIGLNFSWERIKSLAGYGLAYQGKSFLAVIKDDLLTFFLSGVVGPAGIGYWGTAQRWAYFPYRFLVDSVTKVTFPAYARVQESREHLRAGIEKSLFMVSFLLFPVLTLFGALVRNLVFLIPRYAKWAPALPSIYLLAAAAGVTALMNILVNVLDATGRVRTTLTLMIFWIVTTWILTLWAVARFGFTGISLATLLVTSSIFLVIYLVKKVVPFNFLTCVWRQTAASFLAMPVVIVMTKTLPNNYLTLGLTGITGGIIYLGLMLILARDQVRENLAMIFRVYFPKQ